MIYYDLPKGYSPAEVSQIYADGLTWEALSATLCDWQVKGYIEIVSTKEFFSVGTKINKKKEMGEDFPPFEQWLWRYFKLDKNGYWDSEKFRSMASTFDLLEAMLSSLLKQYQNVLYVSTDFVRIKIAGIQRLSYSESGQKNESIFVFLCLFLFFIVFAVVIVRE